jgi:hypothetical protein
MNAYDIFLVIIPLVIVNFIIIIVILFYNLDEFISILKNRLPDKKDRDNVKPSFVFFVILLHLIPLLWIIYILQTYDIIRIFHPNFMGIFLQASIIPILYAYFESKLQVYGDINYLAYYVVYIILLFASCIYLYYK